MLIRTDPFRELDRLSQQVPGTSTRPATMPMDAYRKGDNFYIHFDLPGISPKSIQLTAEHNVLTIRADRRPIEDHGIEMTIAERPVGTFSRQVILSETLDVERITADYAEGVLTLTVPVRESAKPHTIHVTSHIPKQPVSS